MLPVRLELIDYLEVPVHVHPKTVVAGGPLTLSRRQAPRGERPGHDPALMGPILPAAETGQACCCSSARNTLGGMERPGRRLIVTLDPDHAERLAQIAERTDVQEVALAGSLLAAAIDEVDPYGDNITAVLEGIPGLREMLMERLARVRAGEVETISNDELWP